MGIYAQTYPPSCIIFLFKQHLRTWWTPNLESLQEILALQQEVSEATMNQVVQQTQPQEDRQVTRAEKDTNHRNPRANPKTMLRIIKRSRYHTSQFCMCSVGNRHNSKNRNQYDWKSMPFLNKHRTWGWAGLDCWFYPSKGALLDLSKARAQGWSPGSWQICDRPRLRAVSFVSSLSPLPEPPRLVLLEFPSTTWSHHPCGILLCGHEITSALCCCSWSAAAALAVQIGGCPAWSWDYWDPRDLAQDEGWQEPQKAWSKKVEKRLTRSTNVYEGSYLTSVHNFVERRLNSLTLSVFSNSLKAFWRLSKFSSNGCRAAAYACKVQQCTHMPIYGEVARDCMFQAERYILSCLPCLNSQTIIKWGCLLSG